MQSQHQAQGMFGQRPQAQAGIVEAEIAEPGLKFEDHDGSFLAQDIL